MPKRFLHARDSQCEMILRDLKDGHRLTAGDALSRYGCFRMAARINDLRKRGYSIQTMMLWVHGKRIAVYRMEGK